MLFGFAFAWSSTQSLDPGILELKGISETRGKARIKHPVSLYSMLFTLHPADSEAHEILQHPETAVLLWAVHRGPALQALESLSDTCHQNNPWKYSGFLPHSSVKRALEKPAARLSAVVERKMQQLTGKPRHGESARRPCSKGFYQQLVPTLCWATLRSLNSLWPGEMPFL